MAEPLRLVQSGFALPEFVFRLLPVLNVVDRRISLEDVSLFVPPRHGAVQEPPISPVRPAKARFYLKRFPSHQGSGHRGRDSMKSTSKPTHKTKTKTTKTKTSKTKPASKDSTSGMSKDSSTRQ